MRNLFWVIGLVMLGILAWFLVTQNAAEAGKSAGSSKKSAAPVEVRPVLVETIELRRQMTGTLESPAQFIVAPKVGGTVQKLMVDLSDPIRNGQTIAELDDEEFRQELAQTRASLEVAKANLVEANSHFANSERELKRITSLQKPGVTSEAQVDTARAQFLSRQAGVEVAKAQIVRAEANLAAAEVRLSYTQIKAQWEGEGQRYVSQRFINPGATISANTPMLAIVKLDPIRAVVFIAERDYGLLQVGQRATITTDAFPNRSFQGEVARVAPVFNQASRQARVELTLENPEKLLKPGMFIRAEVLLKQESNATVVPLAALVTRAGETGVFVVTPAGDAVRWQKVTTGIRQADKVQVEGSEISGRVVTLGQQLIEDGSPITIPQDPDTAGTAP